ncbi:hypothetical protein [Sediminibacillus albus]|uniref:Uncharacterized protein n=1 Tax=Sediminibacillus albus TaxID=407036 RepID=A0A1G8YAK9_9BACI|nr:hypothetical protein [Sediminibacillus albus]SDJ99781.1 hypothetical protein SAMN05216243_1502 [Sediminibacillus albus]
MTGLFTGVFLTSYIWDYELTYDELDEQWYITNNTEVDEFETEDREMYKF